jgi:hypothetical protein
VRDPDLAEVATPRLILLSKACVFFKISEGVRIYLIEEFENGRYELGR